MAIGLTPFLVHRIVMLARERRAQASIHHSLVRITNAHGR
jgi:hypothetical protein